jgi:hypothetical protein
MGFKSLVQVEVTLAILAVSTGKLPLILKEVRKAQLVLLEESKASRWGQVLLPPSAKKISDMQSRYVTGGSSKN